MRNSKRWVAVLAALVAVLALALPAIADDFTNDVTAITGTDPALFAVDGGSEDVYYTLVAVGGDGQTGCNATTTQPTVLAVTPLDGLVATPSSVSFPGCGTANKQKVTYTATAPGVYNMTGARFAITGGRGGTYNKDGLVHQVIAYKIDSYVPGTPGDPATSCTSTIGGPSPTESFDVGDLVCERIFAYPEALGAVTFEFTAPDGAPVTSITPTDAVLTDNRTAVRDFQPAECGTWTVRARDVASAVLDTDTFAVTGCGVPPELTVPADMTLDTNDPSGAVATFSVSATDVADAKLGIPLAPTCAPASGSTFAVGTTEVTCSVTDSHGNTTTGSFDVTVNLYQAAFEAPIDTPSVVNVAKVGRVIPIKAAVSMNGSTVMTGPVTLAIRSWAGCGTGAVDGIETFAPAGSSNEGNAFRWADGRWMYNLDTSGLAAGCYQGQVLTDGHLAGWFLIKLAR